jgi:hypothetical protein
MANKQLEIWADPAKEIGEVLVDQAVDDFSPFLANIPLVSLVVAGIKSGKAASDYLLAKKVQSFYEAWENLSKKDRKPIYEKFQKKPRDFVEKLLFILANQEDTQKCKIIGNLTVEYLQNNMKKADFYDVIETVDKFSLGDLEKLGRLAKLKSMILPGRIVTERYANLFVGRGLIESAPEVFGEQRTSAGQDYRLTKLGERLARSL